MVSSLKRTPVLKINPKNPDSSALAFGAGLIKRGRIVAFPTETVYGLAANMRDKKAVADLYKIKGRPKGKPFTVHIADIRTIGRMGCSITKDAATLMNRFWPGPMTIVLKKSRGNKTIGFRMPDNKIALGLIRLAAVPVVAPSANMSGARPPKSPEEVLDSLDGKVDLLIDGGRAKVGIESTVIDMSARSPRILREGAVKKEAITGALKRWIE